MDKQLLGGLTAETFLARHWQRRPLMVRGALPEFNPPLTPEELAGLACEEEFASRLVWRDAATGGWQLRHGPFEAQDFARLPDQGWTLLVQAVDRRVPAVARLLDLFRFIPNWRIDDVMISYAAPGGGVGPHVDRYDVFLVQGTGRRRWRIHHTPVADERLLPGTELRVLAEFKHDEEWVVEPGDLLYLPPRVAHEGVAVDACMTLSVGFRAPSERDLVAAVLTETVDSLDPERLFEDPDLPSQHDPGEITRETLSRLREFFLARVRNEAAFRTGVGRLLTTPRREGEVDPTDAPESLEAWIEALDGGAVLSRSAPPHFAHIEALGEGRLLFVGGEAYPLDAELAFAAPLLCGRERLDARALRPHLDEPRFVELLDALVARGFLILETPDDADEPTGAAP